MVFTATVSNSNASRHTMRTGSHCEDAVVCTLCSVWCYVPTLCRLPSMSCTVLNSKRCICRVGEPWAVWGNRGTCSTRRNTGGVVQYTVPAWRLPSVRPYASVRVCTTWQHLQFCVWDACTPVAPVRYIGWGGARSALQQELKGCKVNGITIRCAVPPVPVSSISLLFGHVLSIPQGSASRALTVWRSETSHS